MLLLVELSVRSFVQFVARATGGAGKMAFVGTDDLNDVKEVTKLKKQTFLPFNLLEFGLPGEGVSR